MKKVISIALVAVLALSVFAMVGCSKDKTPEAPEAPASTGLKFGMGIVSTLGSVNDAEDENGSATFEATAVAVLLDKDNKIVAIDLDTADISAQWTTDGKAIAAEDLRTKYEKGTDYGMAKIGKKEWNEQADAFIATATGKTLDEVKAFAAADGAATGDLATAGCTINVASFIKALEEAVANAVDSKAIAENKLNLAIVTSVSSQDAEEDVEGKVEINSTIVAAVVDAEGKVVVSKTDCAQAEVKFDEEGVAATEAGDFKTKGEKGADYGMSKAGFKEWNEQAAAFDATLVGKKAADFAALMGEDTKGTGELATAGCTIFVSDMIKAAEKAAK